MKRKKHFGSMVDAVCFLTWRGFLVEFYLTKDGLWNSATKVFYPFKDASIVDTINIEAQSTPDYIKCIYAIRLKDGTNGIIVNHTGDLRFEIDDSEI